MTTLEAVAILFQLVVPLALIARVAFALRRKRIARMLDFALAAVYLVVIAFAAPWLALPGYLSWLFALLLLGAAALAAHRTGIREDGPRRPATRAALGVRAVLVVLFAGAALLALSGRQRFEEPATDLAFPLREGTYLVASGGSRELVNPHLKTRDAARYRPYRGQSYALDIVKVGSWGSRRSGISPDDPSGFAIFGESLHAPCSGTVVQAVDGHPDRSSAGTTPRTLEGNHVMLECGGVWIVLAHLQEGSVRVAEGQVVRVGDILGRVGNSGRSDEPHLHIHAQTPGTREAPLGGQPVPITFGGRHLVRNDHIRGN